MKDKEKEIQSILNEYNIMRRKSELNEDAEEQNEKSVINPELTLEQMRKLNEKDLNIQVMKILVVKQDEIKEDEKKANEKINKVKEEIGNFRYTYDENENATNADEMKKLTQKYERIRKEQAKIKGVDLICKDNLSDFEKKTGLTVNNIKEMMIKDAEKQQQYELEQEKLRKERIEREEKRKIEELEGKKKEEEQAKLKAQEETIVLNEETQIEQNIEEKFEDDITNKSEYDKDDIVIIYPYKNSASYIFEGKEGKIENIRDIIWSEKPNVFNKFKIKEEEYVLTNNNTGETKEYASKLNPVVFEIFKTNPEKLEDYMNLKSKTAILYVFEDQRKKNKDVAKMMNKYQKQDNQVSQKIGYLGIRDKINAKFNHKSKKTINSNQLALPEGKSDESIQEKIENEITENNTVSTIEQTKSKIETIKKTMKLKKEENP